MSYNPYAIPPPHFGNVPGYFCPPRQPPPNFYPPRFNVDFSRPPPPMTAPTNPPPPMMLPSSAPPGGFHPHRFPPPHMPQIPPYGTDVYRSMLPPSQCVPFTQGPPRPPPATPEFRCHQMRTTGSGPVSRWNGPRPVRTPMVNHTQGGNAGTGGNGWSVKRQHNDQAGTSSMQQVNKKRKINKREMPENNAFYCDCCDRGFKTTDKLKEHVDQHIKCRVNGCTYVAAPKLVQLHYEFQHKTGLAKKIWLQSSKEEDEKWILERKRNWPTAENKERKRKEAAERRTRGDVLDNRYFGKMHGGRGGGRADHRGRGSGRGGYRGFNDRNSSSESTSIDLPASTESADGLKTEVTDSPTVIDSPTVVEGQKNDNSCNDTAHAKPTVPEKTLQPAKNKLNTLNQQKKPATPQHQNQFKRKRKSTLLEKLLAPEIRHERNVILQCVKFVVQHFNLQQSLLTKTICKEELLTEVGKTTTAEEIGSNTIGNILPITVGAASDEQTLEMVVEDTTTIHARDVNFDSAESSGTSTTMSVSDLTRLSVGALAVDISSSAVSHIDGTDVDSGIGSPPANVSSCLPNKEINIL